MTYFQLLPRDIRQYFCTNYLPEELSLMYRLFAPFGELVKIKSSDRFVYYCAIVGYQRILQWWLRTISPKQRFVDLPPYGYDPRRASKDFHSYINSKVFQNETEICTFAAYAGHFELLKWLVANGAGIDWDCYLVAAEFGRIEILQWLMSQDQNCYDEFAQSMSIDRTEKLVLAAVKGGQIPMLQWLIKKSKPFPLLTSNIASVAAEWGQLETLKYLLSLSCAWDETVCTNAAKYGHLELLKWARANEAPWPSDISQQAVQGDNTKILDWLWAEKLLINDNLSAVASEEDCVNSLQWLHEHGIEMTREECIYADVLRNGHAVAWYRETYGDDIDDEPDLEQVVVIDSYSDYDSE